MPQHHPIRWQTPKINEVVTRSEAKARGLKRYFTGKACKNGHVMSRNVANGCCLACAVVIAKRYYDGHAEERRAVTREYLAAASPEWKKAHQRKYHQKHRIKLQEKQKIYNAKNPDLIREIKRRWKAKNKHQAHIDKHARRAREAGCIGKYTAADLKRIRTMQKDKCAYCKTSLKASCHLDHIIPLARGGDNFPSNIQFLCGPCNMKKNAKDPIDFARSRGLLL